MKRLKSKRYVSIRNRLFVLVSFFGIFAGIGMYYYKTVYIPKQRVKEYELAYKEYITAGRVEMFQKLFVKDLKHSQNDKYTKEGAYFIVSRYINNGGDIYELYDYSNSSKELSFLKEAESIYPDDFEFIRNKQLPFTYSDQGMYAYLAYLEVLEKHGYADIAITGGAAGQYAKMAYYKRMILEDKSKGLSRNYPTYSQKEIDWDVSKSLFFIKSNEGEVMSIINGATTTNTVYSNVIGLIQYASALRYLNALDVSIEGDVSSKEIFDFTYNFSHKFLPELYLFNAISNASTLILDKNVSNLEIRNAVYPFFSFNPRLNRPTGSVDKIIKSKYTKSKSRFADLDIYSQGNVITFGQKVPEFKQWLIVNGWRKSDFNQ